ENSNPVEDPVLKAKILAARKILNQPYVTDEDIWRLEREGKLAHLQANPTPRPERIVDPRDPQAKDPGPPPAGPITPNGEGDRLGTGKKPQTR
ncbi:MAG TPA: hypothetical protein VK420_21105, partial [Longimicrobium sp.]|nr:hypothetical protein [Longimicrobium sp.]